MTLVAALGGRYARLWPALASAVIAWLTAPAGPLARLPPAERAAAVARELAARGLDTTAADVRFLDDAPGGAFASRPARPRPIRPARPAEQKRQARDRLLQ